jgi:ATP-dependent DNA helicase RecQ
MRQHEDEIKRDLKKCVSFGIISYTPQNDEPQIVFRKNRVAAEELLFNTKEYNKRKDAFNTRVQKMISYIKVNSCRSIFINTYFGDNDAKPCGICDNCLKSKNEKLSAEEFETITKAIKESLNGAALSPNELLNKLTGIKKEKAWKVIDYLQAENKIMIVQEGKIKLS